MPELLFDVYDFSLCLLDLEIFGDIWRYLEVGEHRRTGSRSVLLAEKLW